MSCTANTNSAASRMYRPAIPASTMTRYRAQCTMFLAVTTRTAEKAMVAASMAKKNCCATTPLSFLGALLGLGAHFEGQRIGHGGHPLAQARLVVQEVGDVDLGVLVLRTPEQGVEGAYLHA